MHAGNPLGVGLAQQGVGSFPAVFHHVDEIQHQGEAPKGHPKLLLHLLLQGLAAVGQGDPLRNVRPLARGHVGGGLRERRRFAGERGPEALVLRPRPRRLVRCCCWQLALRPGVEQTRHDRFRRAHGGCAGVDGGEDRLLFSAVLLALA
ncbi:MAG TPA: hypothetical protein VIU62_18890 [Chloroflexota bacterium]